MSDVRVRMEDSVPMYVVSYQFDDVILNAKNAIMNCRFCGRDAIGYVPKFLEVRFGYYWYSPSSCPPSRQSACTRARSCHRLPITTVSLLQDS